MRILLIGFFLIFLQSCTLNNKTVTEKPKNLGINIDSLSNPENIEIATFGAGCFWCVETIFAELKGVQSVHSGYMGGELKNPTYKDVSSGTSGHAEVIQITFDTTLISYETLLEVFWSVHNPTTVNRQGADVGTQYRSAVFYHSITQQKSAMKIKENIGLANIWDAPIVTEITAASTYYMAEEYHQDYYELNPNAGYCTIVINPKVIKFRKKFEHLLK